MGRAMRWLKKVFGGKKKREVEEGEEERSKAMAAFDRHRWSFRRYHAVDGHRTATMAGVPSQVRPCPCEHDNGGGAGDREAAAAVVIQKFFRGYLARKALRALRSLVKLQALARGYLVRKQTVTTLRRLQALMRIQAASCGSRSSRSSCHHNLRSSSDTVEAEVKVKPSPRAHRRRNSTSIDCTDSNYEQSPRIIEIDTCQIRSMSSRITGRRAAASPDDLPFPMFSSSPLRCKPAPSSRLSLPLSTRSQELHVARPRTAQSTPWPVASECVSPITPAMSTGALDGLVRRMSSADGGHPRYMSNTVSSAARARRSISPKQRRPETATPTNKISFHKAPKHVHDYFSGEQAMDYYLDKFW